MTLTIPAIVVADVRAHALEVDVDAGFEVGGGLLIEKRTERVVLYVRAKNLATEPCKADFRISFTAWEPDHRLIPLHSHPWGPALPSQGDLEAYSGASGLLHNREFAIFSIEDNVVGVFRVGVTADGRVGGFRSLPITIIEERSPA